MSEFLKKSMRTINAATLTSIAYGINGAGGGGNTLELYNPDRRDGIMGLEEEIGGRELPLYEINDLRPDDTVCSIARLGKPGALADQYATQASEAVVAGLVALAEKLGKPFPKAVFPVEATAGQLARATRAALAATEVTGKIVGLVDGDVCGGLAVPSVPLACNIQASLSLHPEIALVELTSDHNGGIVPKIEIIHQESPVKLEHELRIKAADAKMGAIWFAWLMSNAHEFNDLFTPYAVSSSLSRGSVVQSAIENKHDPASELLKKGEIDSIIAQGVVTDSTAEDTPGFAQFSYVLQTNQGPLKMAARNEYIVIYDESGKVIVRAPNIICVLDQNGPVQTHVLHKGMEIVLVSARPQCLINHPESELAWLEIWEQYWQQERQRKRWNHPY